MRHLVARFFRSLRPNVPTPADERWARSYLTAAEWDLFAAQPVLDRSHGLAGARLVAADRPDARDGIEAALVHDVGKRRARLGVFGRSVATATGWVLRADDARTRWAASTGGRGRVGTYLCHGELGAVEVEASGGSALAVAWTRDHHHPDRYGAMAGSSELIAALAQADHDT